MSKAQLKNLGDIYSHPLGRDIIDKIFLQLGLSQRILMNPVVQKLPLAWLRLLAAKKAPGLIEALENLLEINPDRLASAFSNAAENAPKWWESAVFYQIYPRSFADANGDGIGDLRGIINKLDYLENLGVDCLWLSPIFASPNEDMGYDVSNYRAIMDLMGTEADLDELVEQVHKRGMRIILDLVVNHTSQAHSWFQEALANPEGEKAAYYFLRPGVESVPPNNWVSFFSGKAWRWIPEIKRWALHLFAPGQMDLNWDNPQVRQEVADIMHFWLGKDIDGFRLDVINYISKQAGLPDGVEAIGDLVGFTGIENYFIGPHLHEYLRELRAAADAGKDGEEAVLVGETPGIGVEVGRLLSHKSRKELDLYFNFDVLEMPGKIRWDDYKYAPSYFLDFYLRYLQRLDGGDQMAIFSENHDNPRIVSKITANRGESDAVAKLIAAISLTLPGTPFLFQGQELGAINQEFSDISQLRDVESINYYAELLAGGMDENAAWARIMAGSRDHARVPMPWNRDGEFTSSQSWIAGTSFPPGGSVEEQLQRVDSVLNFYRTLISLRKEFVSADFQFLKRSGDYAVWRRGNYVIEVNLGEKAVQRKYTAAERSGAVILQTGEIFYFVRQVPLLSKLKRDKHSYLAPYAVVVSKC